MWLLQAARAGWAVIHRHGGHANKVTSLDIAPENLKPSIHAGSQRGPLGQVIQ